jgi:hypothetical protein
VTSLRSDQLIFSTLWILDKNRIQLMFDSSLHKKIEREINITNNDVEPRMIPNIRAWVQMAEYCFEVIEKNEKALLNNEFLNKKENATAKTALANLLYSIALDLKEHKRWSFWHFIGTYSVVSIYAQELILRKEHEKIK